jgi:hypothetical protein
LKQANKTMAAEVSRLKSLLSSVNTELEKFRASLYDYFQET